VREAADGAEALEACRAEMPRAVLLDWNMPVMDGISFLRAARAEFGPDHPIVVLCTTEAAMDRIVEALQAGAQEYIMKPFDEALLQDKFVQAGLLPDLAA
jgi:two-component system chemotaxis response regulator CheY